jgi:hypothetical protein
MIIAEETIRKAPLFRILLQSGVNSQFGHYIVSVSAYSSFSSSSLSQSRSPKRQSVRPALGDVMPNQYSFEPIREDLENGGLRSGKNGEAQSEFMNNIWSNKKAANGRQIM